MGTREVYEEKLRTGNLHHDPTINPGLGSARCPRCLSLLNPNSERGEWTITPVLHDATAVAGSGIGGMLGFVHGFNTDLRPDDGCRGEVVVVAGVATDAGLPLLQNGLKGPKWLPFVVGIPPLLIFSGLSAAFGGHMAVHAITAANPIGYVLPKFTQLTVTSYYASSSASHYGISLLTRHIEENYSSKTRQHLKRL
ncbi:hypothetical protein HKD37_09G025132 [Glycine soja]